MGFFCGQRLIKSQTTKVFETFVVSIHEVGQAGPFEMESNKRTENIGKSVTAGFPAYQIIFRQDKQDEQDKMYSYFLLILLILLILSKISKTWRHRLMVRIRVFQSRDRGFNSP